MFVQTTLQKLFFCFKKKSNLFLFIFLNVFFFTLVNMLLMDFTFREKNKQNNKNSIKLHLFTKYTKLNINISSLFPYYIFFIIIDIYEL